jgi:GABA(A) receptor-associated protein
MKFKNKISLEARIMEANRVLLKYPDRIPIICEKINNNNNIPSIDKTKYLVPRDLSIGQFIYVIRQRLKMPATSALFIFIKGTIPPSGSLLCNVYEQLKDHDGFLYVEYSSENTFGNK